MTQGIEIRDAAGTLTYSIQDVTWNQVGFFLVAANGSFAANFPVLEGREFLAMQILVDPPPLDRRAVAHTITRDGNNVSVSGGSENAYIIVLMR